MWQIQPALLLTFPLLSSSFITFSPLGAFQPVHRTLPAVLLAPHQTSQTTTLTMRRRRWRALCLTWSCPTAVEITLKGRRLLTRCEDCSTKLWFPTAGIMIESQAGREPNTNVNHLIGVSFFMYIILVQYSFCVWNVKSLNRCHTQRHNNVILITSLNPLKFGAAVEHITHQTPVYYL